MGDRNLEQGRHHETKDRDAPAATPDAARLRLRIRDRRAYLRRRYAEALEAIAGALIDQCKQGSVTHIKLLLQMAELDKPQAASPSTRLRGRTLEAILTERWEKDAREQAEQLEAAPEKAGQQKHNNRRQQQADAAAGEPDGYGEAGWK